MASNGLEGTIRSMQVGRIKECTTDGQEWTSAIHKKPVEGPLHLGLTALIGDEQADLIHHGGPDKAVCVYCWEHYPYWTEQLGRSMDTGAFGENWTVAGLLESQVCIGDIFQAGTALVQLSQPRQPCHKLTKRHQVSDMALQVQSTGYTGYYFRVLQEGVVSGGDRLVLVERLHPNLSVSFANKVMYNKQDNLDHLLRLLEAKELSASWRETLQKRVPPSM